jgi:hypothetical protein
MMTSPYDGYSRAPLRVGLAVVGAFDAVALAVQIHVVPPSAISSPLAPRALLSLHDQAAPLGLVVAVALVSLALFALRRCVVLGGVGAVAALGVLSECHAALLGGPRRAYFFSGAMILGWVFGTTFARGVATGTPRRAVSGEERLAEIGSIAVLAATYTGAAASKLLLGGREWTDGNHLRAILVSQHRVDDVSIVARYLRLVVDHGSVALALGAATLVLQLGAVALVVSPKLRAAWAVGLLGFHVNVWLLAGIFYAEATALLLLFGFPWGAMTHRARAEEPPFVVAPGAERRTGIAALAVVAALVVVAELGPERRYAPSPRADASSGREARAEDFALLGGLAPGDSVAGLRVRAIEETSDGAISIDLAHDTGTLVVLVAPHGARSMSAPRSTSRYDLFYEEDPPMTGDQAHASIDAALDEILARVVAHEAHAVAPAGT